MSVKQGLAAAFAATSGAYSAYLANRARILYNLLHDNTLDGPGNRLAYRLNLKTVHYNVTADEDSQSKLLIQRHLDLNVYLSFMLAGHGVGLASRVVR